MNHLHQLFPYTLRDINILNWNTRFICSSVVKRTPEKIVEYKLRALRFPSSHLISLTTAYLRSVIPGMHPKSARRSREHSRWPAFPGSLLHSFFFSTPPLVSPGGCARRNMDALPPLPLSPAPISFTTRMRSRLGRTHTGRARGVFMPATQRNPRLRKRGRTQFVTNVLWIFPAFPLIRLSLFHE